MFFSWLWSTKYLVFNSLDFFKALRHIVSWKQFLKVFWYKNFISSTNMAGNYTRFFFKGINSIIFILCLSLTIWQFQLCIEKFRDKPEATIVSVENNADEMFPAFTFCPKPQRDTSYNPEILKKCNIKR